MIYEYQGKLYTNVSELNDDIAHEVGKNMNNRDPYTSQQFIDTWHYEVDKLPETWDTFKAWCFQENLKPSHGSSVIIFYEEVRESEKLV
jgi:hypothetical protein